MKKGILRLLMLMMGCFFIHNLHAEGDMKRPVVVFETNKGNFEVTLFPDVAPKTCENFLGLAQNNKYNGVKFHRVIPKFMIQGGDTTKGDGTGGISIWGKDFADECAATVTFSRPGLLAMANKGPNTNGSQFFITTAATPWLNGKHTIFGEVTKGYDEVVKAIEAQGTDRGTPRELLKILKVYPKAD
ncbi:MAG TPA: peptidylprolyl isomerase [Rhabdochlamydiaceae bacterium]|jgi:peptidylprolyl isomerase|nr:peptidylprolyl isomerase [Rhabdochlamydiaceae bacterium]